MKQLWNSISHLGIIVNDNSLSQRNIILTNRLNATLLSLFIVLLVMTRIEGAINDIPFGMGSLRVLLFILLFTSNLLLARFKRFKLCKLSIIVFPPILFIVLPTIVNFIEEESFVYYQYALIAFSIIPQLILIPSKERLLYWFSVMSFFLAVIFVDNFVLLFVVDEYQIIPLIESFYTFYKAAPIAIFIFLHSSVYYLRNLNEKYELEVQEKNVVLDKQNEELKTAFEHLEKTKDQLVHAEKMAALGNLTSGVSHEINNPLNYIAGGLFFIEDLIESIKRKEITDVETTSETLEKSVEMISSGISRATRIVQLLSVFSGSGSLDKKVVSIKEIIDGTLCFVATTTAGVVTIKKNYTDDVKASVFQDQLHKVLLSIIENSIDAIINGNIDGKGEVEISLFKQKQDAMNYVHIEISNNGPKISEDKINRLFEPFYSTKDHKLNSGLGLTAAYAIVKEHEGDILIKNTDSGVINIIKLPV